MKSAWLPLLLAAVFLSAGCSPAPSRAANVAGQWQWVCCGKHYHGTLELAQAPDGKLTGRMTEATAKSTDPVTGSITGNFVHFIRTWDTHQQEYTLALSSDGRTLNGTFGGTHDRSTGTDFEARKN